MPTFALLCKPVRRNVGWISEALSDILDELFAMKGGMRYRFFALRYLRIQGYTECQGYPAGRMFFYGEVTGKGILFELD